MRKNNVITINNIKWNIVECDENSEALQTDEGGVIFGLTKFSTSEIFIRCKDISDDIRKRTIVHEVCHGYIYSFGIDGEHMNEEDVCNFVESFAEKIAHDANLIDKRIRRHLED